MSNDEKEIRTPSWSAISAGMRGMGSVVVPSGLAERAYRAALSHESSSGFLERFILVARRAFLFGAVASAAVWLAVLLNTSPEIDPGPDSLLDAEEHDAAFWMSEDAL